MSFEFRPLAGHNPKYKTKFPVSALETTLDYSDDSDSRSPPPEVFRRQPRYTIPPQQNEYNRNKTAGRTRNTLRSGKRFDPEQETRISRAILADFVEDLKKELNPELYSTKNYYGYNVLHFAIIHNRKQVFDYLLNLPDFPFEEFRNDQNQTALALVLEGERNEYDDALNTPNPIINKEYYACKLIQKGATLKNVSLHHDEPIHFALKNNFFELSKLILKQTTDINTPDFRGYTPLELTLRLKEDERIIDMVTNLLALDATVTFNIFMQSIELKTPFQIQLVLYMCLFEQNPNFKVSLNELLQLLINSNDFLEILDSSIEVVFDGIEPHVLYARLCSLSLDSLKMVIEKFGTEISEIFMTYEYLCNDFSTVLSVEPSFNNYFQRSNLSNSFRQETHFTGVFSLETADFLLESELKESVLYFISYMQLSFAYKYFRFSSNSLEEMYCYFLSYGMSLTYSEVSSRYSKHGYDSIFKLFLHMDVVLNDDIFTKRAVPMLLFNPGINIDYFVKCNSEFDGDDTKIMRKLFADRRLTEEEDEPVQVPRLLELTRNCFRKYAFYKFKIDTCKKLVNFLCALRVSPGDQEVILYETEIY